MFTTNAKCNGNPFQVYRKLKVYLELKFMQFAFTRLVFEGAIIKLWIVLWETKDINFICFKLKVLVDCK